MRAAFSELPNPAFRFTPLHKTLRPSAPIAVKSSDSSQLLHFNISGISSRVRCDLMVDPFSLLPLGPHQFEIQLEKQPETG